VYHQTLGGGKGEMEKITILANSSKGETTYSVDFIFEDDRMSIRCSCPAGRFGKFCKHKMSFLKGNDYYLHDDEQYDQLEKIHAWAQKSEYFDYIVKMSKAQRVVDEAESKLKAVKKETGLVMRRGLRRWKP